MSKIEMVIHNESPLLSSKEVLDELGLRPGQFVTEEQMWKVIQCNAASLVAHVKLQRLEGKKDLPDTTELEKTLQRLRQ